MDQNEIIDRIEDSDDSMEDVDSDDILDALENDESWSNDEESWYEDESYEYYE